MEQPPEGNAIARSKLLWWPRPPGIISYGLAVLSVAVALVIALLLDTYLVSAPASLFLCAIMLSAWYGGVRPGLFAGALSLLAFVHYFVTPIHSLYLLPINELPRVVIFLLSALFVGSLSSAQRSAAQSLGMARDDLSRTVAELKRMNEALQTENAERKRAEMLLSGEKRLLEMIARGDSQALILEALCRMVEESASGCFSSILLLDTETNRLRHGSAPSLPAQYAEAIDGIVIGPAVGSCGTAAYRSEPVIVSDIATDPLWADFRELALSHGLRACWSTPILSPAGKVLGTFAIYYGEPRSPTATDLSLIGQITHIASIAIERAHSGEALREQASLLDLTHDTIFVRDMSDVITYWNCGAEELYGWKKEEALGKVAHQLLRTTFPAPLEEITAQLLQSGRWSGELIHTKRDGTEAVVASRWSMQQDEQGRPIATLETNNDISERKRSDEAMARQANLLEQTHDAIIVWEFPRTITYWNRGAEQLYGFSRKEAIGRPSHELLHTEHPMAKLEFEAALERYGEWTGELTHTTRDGRKIIVESRHVLINETAGRRLVLETNRDITDRKRAEEERKRAADSLREAQSNLAHVSRVTTMGELTASLAHEVNQPITAAVTNANTCVRWLAGDTPNIEEAREAAIRSAKDGRRAAEIIGRIRLLFRKGTTERELVDVNDVIREMIVLLRGEATRYSVSIHTDLAADLPQVMADRVQFQQVMMNLIMNSFDAMKDVGGPRELGIKSERAENDQLVMSVCDTGVGLPAQQAGEIFNAFFTTKLQGTGLGLSISRSIVESHGGRLWASDNSTRGATFHIALPTGVEAHQ